MRILLSTLYYIKEELGGKEEKQEKTDVNCDQHNRTHLPYLIFRF